MGWEVYKMFGIGNGMEWNWIGIVFAGEELLMFLVTTMMLRVTYTY